jgi:cytochrome c-type biogenesis protein CcmH
MLRKSLVLVCALLWLLPAFAAIEEVEFNDAQQLVRYKALIAELRCPMCLNANLAGSDAPIAADLRAEIHKQILAGKSDDEILEFLTARYGEFILYKPPLHWATSFLWFTPLLLLLLGFFVLRRMLAGSRQLTAESEPLSKQEQDQLRQLLQKDTQG